MNLELTIRDLSKRANISYNATYRTVSELIDEQILTMKKFGMAKVVKLNKTPRVLGYLSLIGHERTYNNFKGKESKFEELDSYRKELFAEMPNNLQSIIYFEGKLVLILSEKKEIKNEKYNIKVITNTELILRGMDETGFIIYGAENYYAARLGL